MTKIEKRVIQKRTVKILLVLIFWKPYEQYEWCGTKLFAWTMLSLHWHVLAVMQIIISTSLKVEVARQHQTLRAPISRVRQHQHVHCHQNNNSRWNIFSPLLCFMLHALESLYISTSIFCSRWIMWDKICLMSALFHITFTKCSRNNYWCVTDSVRSKGKIDNIMMPNSKWQLMLDLIKSQEEMEQEKEVNSKWNKTYHHKAYEDIYQSKELYMNTK